MVTKKRERAAVFGEQPHLKTARVEVACTPELRARFVAAADAEGLAVGAWARRVLIRALPPKVNADE